MRKDTLENMKGYTREYSFVLGLVGSGVPLEALYTNDLKNTPKSAVYVCISYGKKLGGKIKVFRRFSNRDLISAVKFWANGVSNA